jgi:adenine-specific DNA methylase
MLGFVGRYLHYTMECLLRCIIPTDWMVFVIRYIRRMGPSWLASVELSHCIPQDCLFAYRLHQPTYGVLHIDKSISGTRRRYTWWTTGKLQSIFSRSPIRMEWAEWYPLSSMNKSLVGACECLYNSDGARPIPDIK